MKHLPTLLPLLALLASAPAARAASPADFAWGWELVVEGEGPAAQIDLPAEVLGVLIDPGLRDFALFDRSGRPLPMQRFDPPPLAGEERHVAVPVFSLPRREAEAPVDVRLHLAPGDDRRLRRIDLAEGSGDRRFLDHLLDFEGLDATAIGLRLSWEPDRRNLRARFRVEASDDLANWRTLVPVATVVDLQQGDRSLQRRTISLPPTRARYVRLVALDEGALRELSVEAVLAPGVLPPPEPTWVEARYVGSDGPGIFRYELEGPLLVESVQALPAGDRSLAQATIRSGSDEEGWVERASFPLFRIRQADRLVRQERTDLAAPVRSRRWQVVTSPPLEEAPTLLLAARPNRYVFLLEGEGPWLLAAGSATARHEEAPVEAAIETLRTQLGAAWSPAVAKTGGRRILGGPAALEIPREIPWTTVLLWAVLGAGSLLVAALALRLLRGGATGEGRAG